MMVLDLLNLKYEAVIVDLLKGEGQTPEYLEVHSEPENLKKSRLKKLVKSNKSIS